MKHKDIQSEADKIIYLTNLQFDADLIIYKTDIQSDAEWVNNANCKGRCC